MSRCVVELAQGSAFHDHEFRIFRIEIAGADLLKPVVEFLAFLAQVAAGETLGQDADLVLDDLGRAAERAQAASDAVEGQVRHGGDVAAHGRLNVVHHRQPLRARLAACAAGDAAEGDRIDLQDRIDVGVSFSRS